MDNFKTKNQPQRLKLYLKQLNILKLIIDLKINFVVGSKRGIKYILHSIVITNKNNYFYGY